ncbi:MAG TPA: polysaccharide deacetylase family protein [Solirubrobacteraceae bacterium]|nr:polysaccharide deacetylase family protein [Solirubrobacteraceae bacterium]
MIGWLRTAAGNAGALALLPLSAVPMLLVGPSLVHSHSRFQRAYDSAPHAAPAVLFTPATVARYTRVAPFRGAIPVLTYHGINANNDRYSVSREEFARQMAMLDLSGYRSITIDQFLRFRRGDTAGLPPRPILITFDDGRLDSYRGADRILERHRFSAAMYVITGPMQEGNPFYLTWRELHRMRDSGRWDIQPHAADGHREIVTDPDGTMAPFYANRRFTRSTGLETFPAYTQRVASDIYELQDDFRRQDIPSETFAVPFGDHGQNAKDQRIPRFLDDLLATQFRVVFVQSPGNDPRYTRPTGAALRYEVHTDTTTDALRSWLVRHNPGERSA